MSDAIGRSQPAATAVGALSIDDRSRAAIRMRPQASIFDTLREEIIGLGLRPGTVLSRAELQRRFGLSSTPIRDALLRLQEEGLVAIFPQHATVVAPIDVERARRTQFLRRSVEIEVARSLAAAPEAAVIAGLRAEMRRQAGFARIGEYSAFTEADAAFHRAQYRAAGVDELWELVRREAGHIDRLRRLNLPVAGKLRSILRDHAAIVDAIEAADPDAAERAVRDHLSRSLDFVERLKGSHPEYF